MRLLCIEHKTVFGGGQVALLNALAEWQTQRAEITPFVVCSKGAAIAPHARALQIPCAEMDLGAIEKTRGIAWNLGQRLAPTRALWQTMRAFQPDVLLANGAYSFLASALAANLARVPAVWYEQNTTLPDGRALAQLIRAAREIIVVTEMIRAQFVKTHPRAADKIHVIYNGVDTEHFRADADAARAIRESFGWTESARVVGTVSRLAPEKNVALFLTAAQALARTRPDVKFLVVGDGPERASLQAQFQDANIAFVGQRADVPRLLQICDVFVLASNTEGFSVALVEAMAAGRAIVATDVGGAREALADGACGRLVPPRNVAALTDALQELLRDETARDALGERARARAQQRFTRAQQARQMQNVLERARAISP